MWHFKKKKLYRVAYKSLGMNRIMVELVKAADIGDAWRKVRELHSYDIVSCESIQEVTGNEIS